VCSKRESSASITAEGCGCERLVERGEQRRVRERQREGYEGLVRRYHRWARQREIYRSDERWYFFFKRETMSLFRFERD
jgi:hypothetical protein